MSPIIRWDLIARSLAAYQAKRYHYIEVPWIVSEEAVTVTMPAGRHGLRCEDGPLVGSAEQSFIQMMLDGRLAPDRYVAASPCFRDDDPDDLHFRCFFKVELIEFSSGPIERWGDAVQRMAEDALAFMHTVYEAREAQIVPTAQGLDIELYGVELGSYGYRSFKGFHWVYGTGLAEPRFTQATHGSAGPPPPINIDEFYADPPRTKEPRRPSRR